MTTLLTESDLQKSIVAECELRGNQDPRWNLIFCIPNGGLRTKATGAKLKAEGVKAGVPDLCLPVPRAASDRHPSFHGLFIELKVGNNHPDTKQERWLAALDEQGYCTSVVRDADMAMDLLTWYLGLEVYWPGEARG